MDIANGRVGVAGFWSAGRLHGAADLVVEDGIITVIEPVETAASVHLATPLLSDLQVNGGGGVMVNSDPTVAGLQAILAAHRGLGTGDILPTLITDTADQADAAADAVIACFGETGILGLHLEGPHIAPARRGTHDASFIRPLDERTLATVARLRAAHVPVMVTLAPECADPALLARLIDLGAVVSAGHSTATAEQAQVAFAAGVRCVTHLYNAMEPMTSRAPGLLGAAINSHAHVGVICDGVHVAWDMVRIALRARPKAGLCYAVTDAMATVGGPDHFTLYGQTIHVDNGRLVNAEGHLAGAHVDLLTTLGNLVTHVGLPLDEAIAMVTDIPRAVMGLGPRRIAPGTAVSDVLFLGPDLRPCIC